MEHYQKQIITCFSDQDLYSWSVGLVYLQHFPNMRLRYEFIDRNNTQYPNGFAEEVMAQFRMIDGLGMTDQEISALEYFTKAYFPSWFYVFLKGLHVVYSDVRFWQDSEGHLHGEIWGPAWRVVYYEQFLMAIISELWHWHLGEFDIYDRKAELEFAEYKAETMIKAGVNYCDMGTRRRFSKEHHVEVIDQMRKTALKLKGEPGSFFGTSNLWLASKYIKDYDQPFKCIGTMSHQFISVCAALYGPVEANKVAMKKWYETYYGYLGCYLPDCLGHKAFLKNFSKEDAKLWGSLRIDSGDNIKEFETFRDTYQGFGVNPQTRGIVFSNAIKTETACELTRFVDHQMINTFGMGTELTCHLSNPRIKHANIVIKAIGCQLTDKREELKCVKLSNDIEKATGDKKTIEAYKILLDL